MATYLLLPDSLVLVSSADPVKDSDDIARAMRNTAFCEALSATLSFLLLGVCVGFLTTRGPAFNPQVPLWWSDTTLVNLNNTHQRQLVDDFTGALAGMCLDNGGGKFNSRVHSIGDAVRFGTFELQVIPSTRLIDTGFPPLSMLFAIFYVSVCFQAGRASYIYTEQNLSGPVTPKWNPSRNPFYVVWYLWYYISVTLEKMFVFFYQRIAPVLVGIRFVSILSPFAWLPFKPTRKVEITRWLEYALTSPLQIWIVASLFFIGDILHLFAAAGAQLGLVLLGALIEYYVGRAYRQQFKQKPQKASEARLCAVILCVLTWLIHLGIWLPLLVLFHYQLEKAESCLPAVSQGNWDAAKGAVQATVYIQFGLFSVFGLILTSSVLFACFRPMPDKKALDRARVQNNGIYAVFSVLAKTALDIGFLLVVTLRAR